MAGRTAEDWPAAAGVHWVDAVSAERDAAALATHQRVSDRYRENYNIQVARHEQAFATPAG